MYSSILMRNNSQLEQPIELKEKSIELEEQSIELEEQSIEFEEKPIESEEHSIELEEQSIELEEQSIEFEAAIGDIPCNMEYNKKQYAYSRTYNIRSKYKKIDTSLYDTLEYFHLAKFNGRIDSEKQYILYSLGDDKLQFTKNTIKSLINELGFMPSIDIIVYRAYGYLGATFMLRFPLGQENINHAVFFKLAVDVFVSSYYSHPAYKKRNIKEKTAIQICADRFGITIDKANQMHNTKDTSIYTVSKSYKGLKGKRPVLRIIEDTLTKIVSITPI